MGKRKKYKKMWVREKSWKGERRLRGKKERKGMYKEKERKSANDYKEKRNERLKKKHLFSVFTFSYQDKKEKYCIVLNRKKKNKIKIFQIRLNWK